MIQKTEDLKPLVDKAIRYGFIALDTEFVWERTYYPRLGLIQVGFSGDETYAIDVPGIDDLSLLGEVIADPSIVKILHDARQDLTIIRRVTGAYPSNVFDTALSAGFVGMRSVISLSALAHTLLKVNLPKEQRRTDWMKRPLSTEQLKYAKDDVRYLPELREMILEKAEELGRTAWLHEEMALFEDARLYEDNDPAEQYLRVKGAGKLNGVKIGALRELAQWREITARTKDIPRGHVINDETMVDASNLLAQDYDTLIKCRNINKRDVERYGEAIITAIKKGMASPPDKSACSPAKKGMDESSGARSDFALSYLKGKSMACEIDHALVASRREVDDLVLNGEKASERGARLLAGWRRGYIGDELLSLLKGEAAVRLDPVTGLPGLHV